MDLGELLAMEDQMRVRLFFYDTGLPKINTL